MRALLNRLRGLAVYEIGARIGLGMGLGMLGCASLWDSFGEANADSCTVNPTICTSGQRCNALSNRCEDLDAGIHPPSEDGSTLSDLGAPPPDLSPVGWTPTASNSGAELHGIWGATPNELWAVGFAGTIL